MNDIVKKYTDKIEDLVQQNPVNAREVAGSILHNYLIEMNDYLNHEKTSKLVEEVFHDDDLDKIGGTD